ncbi:MAG TPA: TatD family hydrolase [Desulfobacteria bacterium]|nr:TatD family hydrolase [Desulfobacteria bacterium]
MITETHCHLDDQEFDEDRDLVIARLREQGVGRIINVGYDYASSVRSIKLAKEHPDIFASVGIHPHDIVGESEDDWDKLRKLAQSEKVVAIGEIGLDYYRDLTPRGAQREAFVRQLMMAEELGLPVIVHNREAHADVISALQGNRLSRGGVMHCFSGSWETAKIALNLGFYISFAGPLTFKKSVNLQQVAAKIPLDRVLVETDSPYLSPEPFRGKRNEPANVRLVLEKLAEVKGLDREEMAAVTSHNAACLFGWEK